MGSSFEIFYTHDTNRSHFLHVRVFGETDNSHFVQLGKKKFKKIVKSSKTIKILRQEHFFHKAFLINII